METVRPKVVPAEPVPEPYPNAPAPLDRRPAPMARIRVPLTLTVRPWATLYRLPDGRRWWCVRLREDGTVRTRCVSTARLRAYARINGLRAMEEELDAALARLAGGESRGG